MKRLVWLLLPIFCTLLVQVQPVEPLVQPARRCCCDCGKCGIPDCALPAGIPAATMLGVQPALVARGRDQRRAPAQPRHRGNFFASPVVPARATSWLSRTEALVPTASVPLFREHCSLLL